MKDTRSIRERVAAVLAASNDDDFSTVISKAGLDPKHDLRFGDWSDISFEGADLRGFDFTGARLVNCHFEQALIDGSVFDRTIHESTLRLAEGVEIPGMDSMRDAADNATVWNNRTNCKVAQTSDSFLRTGDIFRDCVIGPAMSVMPLFGDLRLAVSVSTVADSEWNAIVGDRNSALDQKGRSVPNHGLEFCDVMSKLTSRPYRLLTELELARWCFTMEYANKVNETPRYDEEGIKPMPPANAFGIFALPERRELCFERNGFVNFSVDSRTWIFESLELWLPDVSSG
jgi:hypothetical protein